MAFVGSPHYEVVVQTQHDTRDQDPNPPFVNPIRKVVIQTWRGETVIEQVSGGLDPGTQYWG